MSEKAWRIVFISGTAIFLLILAGMSVNSLNQVLTKRTLPVTLEVSDGKKVWQQNDCNDCHTILGIGGYYAPDLTKVIARRGAPWMSAWLADPFAVNPLSKMPNMKLASTDVQNLVSFFTWVGKIDTNNWPPQPLANQPGSSSSTTGGQTSGTSSDGALLFDQKGCSGCHMINGKGSAGPGPDLSHIATTPYDSLGNSAADLTAWLENPGLVKPGTIMPQIPLAQSEMDSLIAYLLTLK